jgi:hypothetical protein
MDLPSTITTADQAAVVLAELWATLAQPRFGGLPPGWNVPWEPYTGAVRFQFGGPLPPVLWLGELLTPSGLLESWTPPDQAPIGDYRQVSATPAGTGRRQVALSDPLQLMDFLPWTLQLVANAVLSAQDYAGRLRSWADEPGQPRRAFLREATDLDALAATAESRIPVIYAGCRDAWTAALTPDVSQQPATAAAAFTTHPISLTR